MGRHQRIERDEAQNDGLSTSDCERVGTRPLTLWDYDQKRHWAVVPSIALAVLGLLIYFAGLLATIIIVAGVVVLLAILIYPTTAERSDW